MNTIKLFFRCLIRDLKCTWDFLSYVGNEMCYRKFWAKLIDCIWTIFYSSGALLVIAIFILMIAILGFFKYWFWYHIF